MEIKISTRKSPLALWQAHHVGQSLEQLVEGLKYSLLEMTTKGDKILDQALSKVGGKDLFVKEIENALLDKTAQVAVHSLKDVPTVLPEGLYIAAYPKRGDPRDALISPHNYTLDTLPEGAKVGTCSLRRAAQILKLRPDINIVPIRGNVQTRLKKMEEEKMDATLLAYTGLQRMEMESIVSQVLEPEICLPAIGQGILAVEICEDNAAVADIVKKIDDAPSRSAALAERAFLHRLEGGCQVPIAGHATIEGDTLSLRGLVASLDGQTVVEGQRQGPCADAEQLGRSLAEELLENGAAPLLAALKQQA